MGQRVIERSIARRLYTEFSKRWRAEKMKAGLRGKPGYRKPTFSEWYAIHNRDREMMKESTPQDVQEYLGVDPWAETGPNLSSGPRSPQEIHDEAIPREERGVTTINVAGDEE